MAPSTTEAESKNKLSAKESANKKSRKDKHKIRKNKKERNQKKKKKEKIIEERNDEENNVTKRDSKVVELPETESKEESKNMTQRINSPKESKKKRGISFIDDNDDDDGEEDPEMEDIPNSSFQVIVESVKEKESEREKDISKVVESRYLRLSITHDPESKSPIVVSFPNGVPPALAQLEKKSEEQDELKFEYRKVSTNTSLSVKNSAVVTKDNVCQYEGFYIKKAARANAQEYSSATRQLVGVFDREQKKLTLHLAHNDGYIYPLTQSFITEESEENIEGEGMQQIKYMERKRLLTNNFGSVKRIKLMKSIEANKVRPNSIVGTGATMMTSIENQQMSESNVNAMLQIIENKKSVDLSTDSIMEARKKSLPPFHQNAANAFDIYKAEDIAGEELWSKLSSFVHRIMKDLSSEEKENWLSHIIEQATPSPDEDNTSSNSEIEWPKSLQDLLTLHINRSISTSSRDHFITSIILLSDFCKLHKYVRMKNSFTGTANYLTRKAKVSHTLSTNHFLQLFTEDGGEVENPNYDPDVETDKKVAPSLPNHIVPKYARDKRLIYLLILCLICSGKDMRMTYKMLQQFCNDIELELQQGVHYLRMAGCTVKINSTAGVSLNAPLSFPNAIKKRRRTG